MTLAPASLSQQLSTPIKSTNQLLSLLVPPLASLGLLADCPDLERRFASAASHGDPARFVKRQLGLVQKALIERVWPDWSAALAAELGEDQGRIVLERFFVPVNVTTGLHADVALSAQSVLLSLLASKTTPSLPPRSLEISFNLLARLGALLDFDSTYTSVFGTGPTEADLANATRTTRWQQIVKDFASLPTRVANAAGAAPPNRVHPIDRRSLSIPAELETSAYLHSLARSYGDLLWRQSEHYETAVASIALLVAPLEVLVSSPTFLPAVLPELVPRLLPPSKFPTTAQELVRRQRHRQLWPSVISELPQRHSARLVRNLLVAIGQKLLSRHSSTAMAAQTVHGAACLLRNLLGPLFAGDDDDEGFQKSIMAILIEQGYAWDGASGAMARVVVAWAGAEEADQVRLMRAALDVWSRPRNIKEGGRQERVFLTTLLLVAIARLPRQHSAVIEASRSAAFLGAISAHLSLLDGTQRYLGMLVAEYVSTRSVSLSGELKPLSFGDDVWNDAGEAGQAAARIRELLEEVESLDDTAVAGWQAMLGSAWHSSPVSRPPPPPPPAEIFKTLPKATAEPSLRRSLISVIDDGDDEDDLQPYPLPAPPSAATLDALASDDASLYSTALPQTSTSATRKRGKLRPPVYIPELTAYLKGADPEGKKEEADGEAERIEVGLREGESLVRRKAGWGGELSENAIDLTFALIGLQDQYETELFDERVLAILAALVAAEPTKAAPAIIEQYFTTSYSNSQRHTMLAALALAARELAGLSIPATLTQGRPSDSFPSKKLPPRLHQQLVKSDANSLTPTAPDDLQQLTADITDMTLSSVREEAETNVPGASREKLLTVRRFASSKSERATAPSGNSGNNRQSPTYASIAAEVFILPLVNRFWLYLRDNASPMAARQSPYSTAALSGAAGSAALLSPMLLSKYLSTLAVLVHASRNSLHFLLSIAPAVLQLVMALRTTALEETDPKILETEMQVLLVVFDAVVALDRGESLMSRSVEGGGALLVEAKEWAEETFEREEGRGAGVGRAGRAAAGVLLRIDEITSRWRVTVGW